MKSAHTPTPWYAYEPQQDNGEIVITRDVSYDSKRLCKVLPVSPEDKDTIANAAFIVKAVNAHDDFVSATKPVQEAWQEIIDGSPACYSLSDDDEFSITLTAKQWQAISNALAKSKSA